MNVFAESTSASVYAAGIASGNFSMVEDYVIQKVVYSISLVEDCGFIGNVNTNAKNAFAGGIVSRNSYAKVYSNYASSTYTNSYEDLNNDSLIVTGAIASITEDTLTVSGGKLINGNHYVKTSESLVGLNIHYIDYYTISLVPDADTNTTAYDSFEEIPEEVRK
jgi:hypothetical protein